MGKSRNADPGITSEDRQQLGNIIEDWSKTTFLAGPDANIAALQEGVTWLYDQSLLSKPKVLVLDSPLGCQIELQAIANTGADMRRVETVVWPAIDFKMWSHLWWQVMGEFLTYPQADSLSNVEENLIRITRDNAVEIGEDFFDFSEDNLLKRYRRAAYYDFLLRTGRVISEQFEKYITFLRAGCFLNVFVRDKAVISRRPVTLQYNIKGQFHCDSGPALEWKDGWAEYFLNGVYVSREVVECPPDQMDAKIFLTVENLEVRREIVRKVGVDILLSKLGGRVIDRWNDYELVQLDVPDMRIKPTYLKMKNPSIGTYHVEGVPPHIGTCREALSWRVGGLTWDPEQLT